VMALLNCAGFAWGVPHLTHVHLATLRRLYQEFAESLRKGDVNTAAGVGAEFSSTVTQASGNRELQTHIDLVVARALRVLALTTDSQKWAIWREGHRETLELLEADNRAGAVNRYRQIYVDYRACVADLPFD
jgi:DNA-binding GntR family transcriptional regulator